ncbi:MAG TPA: SpoIID/LytB domain-containing protein [Frankiaceae bacterium]|jgi:SpoIID/LytB domain protein|nr:SpoIID/LytB domain-containing protein [Frankiaceae bacterium]
MRPLRALRGIVVSALVAAPLAVLMPAAPAFAEEVYGRPADGVFRMEGHGWGHGHGMSQWGAQGAATKGVTYTKILDTYYPGTAQATFADKPIRVLISQDDHTDVSVAAASGLALRDLSSGARYTLPTGATRWRIYVDSSGYRVQSYASAWAAWGSGGKTVWTGPLQFEGPTFLRLHLPDGTARDFRGAMRAVRASTTTINSVNVLSREHYLYGVVPREASASWHAEALKAQSVAARSYSTYKMEHVSSSATYDICSTTSCQVYGGARLISGGQTYELESASTNGAVDATRGVMRTYDGAAIFAEFSSSNGGWSTTGSFPYLAAKADPWDAIASPHHYWTATLTVAQIEAKFPSLGRFSRMRVTQRDGNGDWGGRVRSVILEGVSSSGAKTTVSTTGGGIYSAHTWPASSTGLRGSWWHVKPAYGATVVSQGSVPTLVRAPGDARHDAVVQYKNTGATAWPVAGLHLAVSSPAGSADPMVGGSKIPGRFAGNVTRPGASTVDPGEVAKFFVPLDASSTAVGTYAKAYLPRIGQGAPFGQVVQWVVSVVDPVLSASFVSVSGPAADGSGAPAPVTGLNVILPRDGSVTVNVKMRNTGNVAWPLNAGVRLATSDARWRESTAYGPGWNSKSVVGPVRSVDGNGSATSVAPGQVGVFPVTLHGNGLPVGGVVETFEAGFFNYGWMNGKVRLNVYRVDRAVSRLSGSETRLPGTTSLVAYPGDRRTLYVRVRNLGGSAWPVGSSELLMTSPAGRESALRTAAWLSPQSPSRLARNVSRPGQTSVWPGEVGEYVVPLDPTNKPAGSYAEWFQAMTGSTRYGPVIGTTIRLAAAAFTGSLARNSTGVVIPVGGAAMYSFDVRNTGNTVWPVGGTSPVRATVSGSKSANTSWLNGSRPTQLDGNVTRRGATTVLPGEVGRFTFVLSANGRPAGTYTETFGVGWETWRAMVLSVPVTYTIR